MKTTKQAFAYARRVWGKTACVEDRGARFSIPESEREETRTLIADLRKKRAETDSIKESRELGKQIDGVLWKVLMRRYSVGEHTGFCFSVRGEGDTWDEAFEKAKQSYPQQFKEVA